MCLSVCARRAAARSSPLQSFKYSRSSRSFPPPPTFLPNLCSSSTSLRSPGCALLRTATTAARARTARSRKRGHTRNHPRKRGLLSCIRSQSRMQLGSGCCLGSPRETETRRDERARRRQEVTELRNKGDGRAQQRAPGTGPMG